MSGPLRQLVESLSEAIVFADPANTSTLAEVKQHFVRLRELAVEEGRARTEAACERAVSTIDGLLGGSAADFKTTMQELSQLVSGLQNVSDGASEAELSFPLEYDDVDVPEPEDTVQGLDNPLLQDPEVVEVVISEAQEHLEAANQFLLTLESNATDEASIHGLFRAFHTIKGVAAFLALQDIEAVAHEAENMLDLARRGTLVLAGPCIDISFEVVDLLGRLVERLSTAVRNATPLVEDPKVTADIQHIKMTIAQIRSAVDEEETSEEPANPPPAVAAPPMMLDVMAPPVETPVEVMVAEPLVEPVKLPEGADTSEKQKARDFVRVDAARLDKLVDAIGELVIAKSILHGSEGYMRGLSPEQKSHVGQLDKIARELQRMATTLRMAPLRSVFQKMQRLARDVAKKSNKRIEFVVRGADTEVDRSVVDRIGDPLMHMIRNAIDHGIEDPEGRRAAGKPDAGTVELRAYHRGARIYIEVEDDGKGLDVEAIAQKGRAAGLLVNPQATEQEVFSLIFEPGFSTAKAVTSVSGRGVGLDVVKQDVQALRGDISLRSTAGQGTTVVIRLPLTLAIIDGMVVRIAGERFVIPTQSISTCVPLNQEMLNSVLGSARVLNYQDDVIPVFAMDELLEVKDSAHAPGIALLVEMGSRRAALLVDELVGQQQIVIKPLEEAFRSTRMVAGSAIMSDGKVGLILDIEAVLDQAMPGSMNNEAHAPLLA